MAASSDLERSVDVILCTQCRFKCPFYDIVEDHVLDIHGPDISGIKIGKQCKKCKRCFCSLNGYLVHLNKCKPKEDQQEATQPEEPDLSSSASFCLPILNEIQPPASTSAEDFPGATLKRPISEITTGTVNGDSNIAPLCSETEAVRKRRIQAITLNSLLEAIDTMTNMVTESCSLTRLVVQQCIEAINDFVV